MLLILMQLSMLSELFSEVVVLRQWTSGNEYLVLERFPIECRKTKTKLITVANRNRCKQHNKPI